MEKLTFDNLPAAMAAMAAKFDLLHSKVDRLLTKQEKSEQLPELLTVDEAATYLRKAKQTLYGLCNRRQIPHVKKAGKLYFKRAELDNWLESGKMEAIEN